MFQIIELSEKPQQVLFAGKRLAFGKNESATKNPAVHMDCAALAGCFVCQAAATIREVFSRCRCHQVELMRAQGRKRPENPRKIRSGLLPTALRGDEMPDLVRPCGVLQPQALSCEINCHQ